jgi:hypothetical protein
LQHNGYILDPTKKTKKCSKRCTGGCVSCQCAAAGEICGPCCQCTGCKNQAENFKKIEDDWKGQDLPRRNFDFDKSTSGPTGFSDRDLRDPCAIFSKLWDDEAINLVLHETMRKIEIAKDAHLMKQFLRDDGVFVDWVEVVITKDEIQRYFWACQVMGLTHQPEIHNYWNNSGTNMGIFGCHFIKDLMSRDKWAKVNEWISFPVDLMIYHLNKNFQKYWNLFQHIAIDEILVLFKGRFSGRQHIRGKPNSTGLKFFALCDEKGYLYSFWLYRGKENEAHTEEPVAKKAREADSQYCSSRCTKGCVGCVCAKAGHTCDPVKCKCTNCKNLQSETYQQLSEKVDNDHDLNEFIEIIEPDEIMELLDSDSSPFRHSAAVLDIVGDFEAKVPKDKNYVFLGDSYFGGLAQVQLLAKRGRLALFTCNANRPSEIFSARLDRGLKQSNFNYITHETDKILCVSFYDSKICHFVSNYVGIEPLTANGRPHLSAVYNLFMNGVDKFDSDLNRYLYDHRKTKWTRCLLHNLFKMCVVNSYKIFCIQTPRVQQLTFILRLLNGNFPKTPILTDNRSHLIISTPSKKHCQFCCQDREEEKIAGYRCKTCNTFLHPLCFAPYHEQTNS